MTNEQTIPNPFEGIIGQNKAKKQINFYRRGYNATGILPHLLFVAPKGCGKTMLAKAVKETLMSRENPEKSKKFLEINCSTLRNVKQFFNQIMIPHVQHEEVTILFDESSEIPHDVSMALLTCLNPNKHNRNEFSYEDYTVEIDFSRHTFMFATTEVQTMFHALIDRCKRIDLEEYSLKQLGQILKVNLEGIEFEEGLMSDIASTLRGNARKAVQTANDISSYMAAEERAYFTRMDWDLFKDELGIEPLGLSPIEIQLLEILNDKPECSLTYLSAKTGMTKAAVQRDIEMYLLKNDLMEIGTGGRKITSNGRETLEVVNG
jgi:Holliday junction resolvasome RuvABC ATP-dependent DNA helicase subunit